MNKQSIQKVFDKTTKSALVHEAVLLVENSKGDFSENFCYGGKTIDTPIFTASVAKLFTTTCVLILQEQKKLSIDDLVIDYLDKNTLTGLHVFKGKDYSHLLKISDLLFQSSGLPDYLQEGGIERAAREDFSISTAEIIEITKKLKPHFAPSIKKAYYSDLNFQLLGEVIEKVAKMPMEDIFQKFLFKPLGLTKTYVPTGNDFVPNIYYKNQSIYRPKQVMSYRGGGNAVTTTRELMVFLKAFFKGYFFPLSLFKKLSVYRKVQMTMGPIYYGGGYMQIPLGTLRTLFMGRGELIGHSGHSGSFAFYYPEKDLFFAGDINQLAKPGIPIVLVMKLALINK